MLENHKNESWNWNTRYEIFEALNQASFQYLVLRNYESMNHDGIFCDEHEDIDFLCDNVEEFAKVLHAYPKFSEEDFIHYWVNIEGTKVPVDVRWVGDNYYDPTWAEDMLKKRKMASNGNWYIMEAEDYYYSLAYHAILQKHIVAKDYVIRLSEMARSQGIVAVTIKEHLKFLNKFMLENNYFYIAPKDKSVPFRIEKMPLKLVLHKRRARYKYTTIFHRHRKKMLEVLYKACVVTGIHKCYAFLRARYRRIKLYLRSKKGK